MAGQNKRADGPLGQDEKGIRAELASTIETAFRKAYAKQLASAYTKATGKHLSDPEKHMDPMFGYIVGHAPNVDPAILNKLPEKERSNFYGSGVLNQNPTPEMLIEGANNINQHGYLPLNQVALGVTPNNPDYRQAQLDGDIAVYLQPKTNTLEKGASFKMNKGLYKKSGILPKPTPKFDTAGLPVHQFGAEALLIAAMTGVGGVFGTAYGALMPKKDQYKGAETKSRKQLIIEGAGRGALLLGSLQTGSALGRNAAIAGIRALAK